MEFITQHEPPSIRDEIDRKAWECLERLVRHQSQGKIGTEGLGIGIRSVWETVSGLAGEQINELAGQLHKECAIAATPVVRVFRHIDSGQPAAVVRWTPGDLRVMVLKGGGESKTFDHADEQQAKGRFMLLCDRLANQYEEW